VTGSLVAEYPHLATISMHPSPEATVRGMIDVLVGLDQIDSILDVGSGHGGVFDYGFWTQAPISHRGTCDIHAVREMSEVWDTRDGVDVQHLTDFYRPDSFDLVQCMEVLEHVPDSRTALEQLCAVARRLVIITSDDELVHGYNAHGDFDDSSVQAQMERINPHQRYVAQPRVSDLHELGFSVFVERMGRRRLVAFKTL
jgi:SAM-dependent methyltransferase